MSDILKKIIENKVKEVEQAKSKVSESALLSMIETVDPAKDFVRALKNKVNGKSRVIAECKRKSPSKGVLAPNYDPSSLAIAYENGGAAAISVLTDETYFGGTLKDLVAVKQNVEIPVLRKDFIIDEYQIYETRRFGADTFLLLAGTLDSAKLQYFIEIGREYGMEPLVETHNDKEIEIALKTDAKILGINNRDLTTMKVNPNNALHLAKKILAEDPERILVCESGIKTREDILCAEQAGFHGFLIGESLITKDNPEQALLELL